MFLLPSFVSKVSCFTFPRRNILAVVLAGLIAACGGGGSSAPGAPSSPGAIGGEPEPDNATNQSGEMLNNPGFESPGNPTAATAPGWAFYTPSGSAANYSLDSGSPHGGGTAQMITLSNGQTTLIQAPITLRSGTKYGIAVWLKAQSPTRVQLALRRFEDGHLYVSKTVIVSNDWKLVGMYGFSGNANGQFTIQVQQPGTVWIDDASMVSWSSPARPASMTTTRTIPLQYFGQHMHQQSSSWAWPSAPFGSRRLWDTAGAQWPDIAQCSQVNYDGTCAHEIQYNWSTLDARVAEAEAHGVDVMVNLGLTPTWASARPGEASPYGPGKAAEPKNDQVWQHWVRAVATRYKGRIKYWEVWNEPNYHWNASASSFYTGTPEKLLSLQQQAYAILKAIDSSNVVLTPAFTDIDYLDYYLNIGGGQSADVVAYHLYVLDAPEAVYEYYGRTVKYLAQTYAPGKAVWNTEQGWIGSPMDEQRAAAYLARSFVLNWAAGFSRYYWYAWDNHGMAVQTTHADNVTLTPAGGALWLITNWLVNKRLINVTVDGNGTWIAELSSGDRGASYIVWNTVSGPDNVDFTIPGNWQVSRMQLLNGVESSVSGGQRIAINQSPLFLQN